MHQYKSEFCQDIFNVPGIIFYKDFREGLSQNYEKIIGRKLHDKGKFPLYDFERWQNLKRLSNHKLSDGYRMSSF